MNTADVNPIAFLYFLILILPVIAINYFLRLKVNGRLITAVVRMAVQLIAVGLFLQYVFDLNSAWLNLLFVALMVFAASFSAVRTVKLKFKRHFAAIFAALAVPNVLSVLFFNALLLNLPGILDARYLIAIEGMLLGNSLSGIVIGIDSFQSGIRGDMKRYQQMLSFSCSRREAAMPYLKKAVVSTLNPFIATVETMGIVALPGMMTGQILGGAVPIVAIKYQIAIMLAILAARYFSVMAALLFSMHTAFDEYDMIRA